MRVGSLLLVFAAAVSLAVAADAAPVTRASVSPIIGTWYYSDRGAPVLKIAWEPRGLHGPKSQEIYADVLRDFQMWTGGCWHRKGERLFEVNSTGMWPSTFAGSGVVLTGDVYTSSDCTSRAGSKVTVVLHMFPSSTPPQYGMEICFERTAGGATCAANFWRPLEGGETMVTGDNWADYVAPGKYEGISGFPVSFIVGANGSFTEPVGRWIDSFTTRGALKCSMWSPEKKRWLPHGSSSQGVIGSRASVIPIKQPAIVSFTSAWTFDRGVARRFELSGSFTNWTHLKGTVRVLVYSPVANARALPRNLDKPGKLRLQRCDSGGKPFVAGHIPGSWQEIATSHG